METRNGYLNLDGERTFYEIRGAGPPMILIHGGLLDRRLWRWQAGFFAAHYTVISYDVRGHGKSDIPLEPYAQHDDLRRLLDYMRVPAAILVGLSMGGAIAIDLALEHPSRVTALVLAAPAVNGDAYSQQLLDQSRALYETARNAGAEMALWMIREDPFWSFMAPEPRHAAARSHFFEVARDNMHTLLIDPERILHAAPPAAERLSEIRAPTLIITAERDHPDNRAVVARLSDKVEGATVVDVPGAGLVVNLEQPVRFNMAARGFLNDLGSGSRTRLEPPPLRRSPTS